MQLYPTTTPMQEDMQTIRDGLSASNVAKVPELLQLPHDDVIVVLRDDSGAIIGGGIGEFDWGYLFVDTLWVADNRRGKGHGTRIMQALESYAASRGIQRAYLYTTTFQAKPLYEKLGYQVYGELRDYPRGHTLYFLWKDNLVTTNTDLEVQSPPDPDDSQLLNDGLIADVDLHVPLQFATYAIFLRDAAGLLHGGLWGYFYWNWFDLRFVWMSDSVRGQGFGKQAVQMLFAECQRRDVVGIKSDTASFQSLSFYQAQGFEVFGTLDNRPPGYTSYFIQRRFGT